MGGVTGGWERTAGGSGWDRKDAGATGTILAIADGFSLRDWNAVQVTASRAAVKGEYRGVFASHESPYVSDVDFLRAGQSEDFCVGVKAGWRNLGKKLAVFQWNRKEARGIRGSQGLPDVKILQIGRPAHATPAVANRNGRRAIERISLKTV